MLKPNDTLTFKIPFTIPDYQNGINNLVETLNFSSPEDYLTRLILTGSKSIPRKVLTREDLAEFNNNGVKIFNGYISSNEILVKQQKP